MKIGMIVAVEKEALENYYHNLVELKEHTAFKIYKIIQESNEIYVLQTGLGEIAASAGTQYMISNFGVELVVNFGVVGGLTASMAKHKLCVVDRVVHYKFDCSEFMDLVVGQVDNHDSIFLKPEPKFVEKALEVNKNLIRSTCCSGDKFIGTAEEKQYLHEKFQGDICDMECAAITLVCELNKIPCLILKAVSDGLADGAKGFYDELVDAGVAALTVADAIINTL